MPERNLPSAPIVLGIDASCSLAHIRHDLLQAGFNFELFSSFADLDFVRAEYPVAALVRGGDSPSVLLRICQQIRDTDPHMPLLIVSSNSDIDSKVLFLELGADDYLEEPFAVDELIARLRSIIRSRARSVSLSYP